MYRIVYTRRSLKTLRRIPKPLANRIRSRLSGIAKNPYAVNSDIKRLQGRLGFRLRVGEWRVIYEIQDDELLILVLKIGARGDVYK